MRTRDPLKDKAILLVDDEPDILDVITELLDSSRIDKVTEYNAASKYLINFTYDIVILDIMGVNGFELLKTAVSRAFPTVMLTAHALSPEALKKSIKLGAVFFLPKEHLPELRSILEDIITGGGKPMWKRLFDRFGDYFTTRFGPDWKEKDRFFKELEAELMCNPGRNTDADLSAKSVNATPHG
jgi:CheY-like chemotaxis protein